jgi:NTP pyrophosphatase (non-canonical NTP hydrolase)
LIINLPILEIESNLKERTNIENRMEKIKKGRVEATIHNQRVKILEEAGELFRAFNKEDIINEAIDTLQSTLQIIDLLIFEDPLLFMDELFKHHEKIEARDWKTKGNFIIEL